MMRSVLPPHLKQACSAFGRLSLRKEKVGSFDRLLDIYFLLSPEDRNYSELVANEISTGTL